MPLTNGGTGSTGADLSIMYGSHAAFRRDLIQLAKAAERPGATDPARALAVAAGWATFRRQLQSHHEAEDLAIWPAMRERLEGRADALSILDEMEHEHGFVDPLLEAVDAAFAGSGEGLAEVIGELATVLCKHLDHEEQDALPLLAATITAEEWAGVQGKIMSLPGGAEISPEMFAWILDGADEATTAGFLAGLPPVAQQLYADEWKPAYDAVRRW